MPTSAPTATPTLSPQRYYKYFEGVLAGMISIMRGENTYQTPEQALEIACENQRKVLAYYQEELGKLTEGTCPNYQRVKALIEDLGNLTQVLSAIKNRPVSVPLNPVLCAIVMATVFAQHQALKKQGL